MSDLEKEIVKKYGNQVRIRVCGVWVEGEKMLLAHHRSLGLEHSLWIPPGGGIEFGESMEAALKREFKEETGIDIRIHEFLFVCEFLNPPLHAIEFFFRVDGDPNQLILGHDPEMESDQQLITQVEFVDFALLKREAPKTLHGMLRQIDHPSEIFKQKGYFKIH